jgi:hypothetical protein
MMGKMPTPEEWEEDFAHYQFENGGLFYRLLVNLDRRREGKKPFPWFGPPGAR